MGEIVARATEPTLAAIKLAWWREQLEKLDTESPPAEPRLGAAAAELLPRGIKGAELARLEAGWATLLDESPNARLIEGRGEVLFSLAARLLNASHAEISAAGRLYALMDVTRRGLHDFRTAAVGHGTARIPPSLRPLTGLASLARRDLARRDLGRDAIEPEATPGRSWTLIRHRLTGRL